MPATAARGGPRVVLVGRPNVGKSTLFNRMTGTRRAIVAPVAGTTRDFMSQSAEWRGATFTLTDTGGMFGASQDPLHELVFAQGQRALATADLVVLVVDGREGLVAADEEIAAVLRGLDRPVLLAVNKTDDRRAKDRALEFYRFGFEPVFEVAAEHGTGVAELLDEIVDRSGANRATTPRPSGGDGRGDGTEEVRVAIVGRPERRQVVAGQSTAARGARDGQRGARDDARCDRQRAAMAEADVSHHRHGWHPASWTRGPQRARSKP